MRIGNNIDAPQQENRQVAIGTTNYSKVNSTRAIRLDITDIGKDTGLIIDQGRSIQDVISEAGALDVQTRQDYMTVVSNTMSEEDFAKMCKDGFKPSEMSCEESVTIMDHIKAVMAQSGQVVAGYNDDLSIDKLKAITGNAADANALAQAMKNADVPQTEANAKKIHDAAMEIQGIDSIKDNGIQYMLANDLKPTIDNIYMSNYSVGGTEKSLSKGYYSLGMQGYLAEKASFTNVESIMPDIEKIVSGFSIDGIEYEEQIKEATWLVEKGIDLTQKNIEKLDELLNVKLPLSYEEATQKAAYSLVSGNEAKNTDLSLKNADIYEEAGIILEKTSAIEDNQIKNAIVSGKRLTLGNIWSATSVETNITNDNTQYQQARVNIEEIRLRMTLDVNVSLMKRGIELDTMPLSNLVEALKAGQQTVNSMLFGNADEKALEVKAGIFNTTRKAIEDIPYMPAAVIGRLKIEEEYSLTTVHEIGTELKSKYEAAKEKYETLMTAPRKDLGDSISKAFRNVDDILKDIGLESNEENAKAVRILGYNSMDINAAEVERIRDAYDRVMNVVNSLTPARTLELIRQGINPMEISVDRLADTLKKFDVEESDEKYSRFLYKLDKNNEITSSEREAYIGIYRFVHRLEKTDGAAIGSLMNSNRELTFANLLSGMRSSKVSFNEKIDDNYGFLQDTIKKGISISDQIEQAFINRIGQDKNESLEKEYVKDSFDEYKNVLANAAEAPQGLEAESEAVSADNIAMYNALNSSEDNVFALIRKYSDRPKTAATEKEAEYRDKSNELIENFNDKESAQKSYKSMVEAGNELMEEYKYSAESALDLREIKLCSKQLAHAVKRSNHENYMVPMDIDGEITTINLSIKHGQKNNVEASFTDEKYGRITAHFSIENEAINGFVVSETKEGVDCLNAVVQGMSDKMELPLNVRVVVGKETQIFSTENGNDSDNNADINNVNTTDLYKLAKSFLTEYRQRA